MKLTLRQPIQKFIKKKNKKAQFQSALLAVITLFIVGITIFFISHLRTTFYGEFDEYFNSTPEYSDSEARTALQKIDAVENAAWDWVFLAAFVGLMLQMVLLSFATRINIAFYWIFAIVGVVVLIVGVVLSNVWQEMASQTAFATTITYFPITNAILGSYFPTIIVAILFITMIVLFGKPPERRM